VQIQKPIAFARQQRRHRASDPRLIPDRWITRAASLSALVRYSLDNPRRQVGGLRDYLFVWQKPVNPPIDRMKQPGV
jgi:hypothetical protein